MLKFRPANDRVLIEEIKPETKQTKRGLILPQDNSIGFGTVAATSANVQYGEGTKVYFEKHRATQKLIRLDGDDKEYLLIYKDDLLGEVTV